MAHATVLNLDRLHRGGLEEALVVRSVNDHCMSAFQMLVVLSALRLSTVTTIARPFARTRSLQASIAVLCRPGASWGQCEDHTNSSPQPRY
jgi:hypothetical protein